MKQIRAILTLLCLACTARAGAYIANVNTDKAMYAPGAAVTIYVDLKNTTGATFGGSIEVALTHVGHMTASLPAQAVTNLGAGQTTTKIFSWTAPATDFRGYLVQVTLKNGAGSVVERAGSAVDVSSDWRRFPRYGYVAQFWEGFDAGGAIWQLKNYHINGLQFYDWGWKHHRPAPPAGWTYWQDVANRWIHRGTLDALISAAHGYGMVAMAYDDWGAAYDDALTDGSGVTLSMGRFSGTPASAANQHTWGMPGGWATPRLRLMNNRDAGWQNYIFGRIGEAVAQFGFDGWHMDNLVWDHMVWDAAENQFNLDDYNDDFINAAKTALGGRDITFNNVDGSAVDGVAQFSNAEFIYAELWNQMHYHDLRTFVENVRRFGTKATVFAAYMNRAKTSGFFNEHSVRLANAAMFACGAAHIELGDGGEMLRTEYFPENTVKMSDSLRAAMRTNYDFLVGYENLLRDDAVSTSNAVSIAGVATSTNGSAGTVWTIAKRTLGANVAHFVNLLNNTSTEWRDASGTYPAPPVRTNLTVKMYYFGAVWGGKLWVASPDRDFGAATELSFTTGSDGGGNYVTFTMPELQYWNMAWLETNGPTDAAAQIEAENFVSWAGVSPEPCADSGGGSNIGGVNNVTGESFVAFNNVAFGAGAGSVQARVASAVDGGTIEFRIETATGPLVATVPVGNTGGWQSWRTVSAPATGAVGTHRLFVVFKNAPSNLNWFTFTLLPAPWSNQDIGNVGVGGSASYDAGAFAVNGSGADVWGTEDAFHFVSQDFAGDGAIVARVTSLEATHPNAKAGVMLRSSTAADSSYAFLFAAPGYIGFETRGATGANATGIAYHGGIALPVWLKLTRSGATCIAWWSGDGTNWSGLGTQTSAFSAVPKAGLAVTAHDNSQLNTGTFTDVSLTAFTGYTAWQFQNFTAAQLADASISGPLADANDDGHENLLAYAAGLSPWTTATTANGGVPLASNTGGYLTLTFTRLKNAPDLTRTVEVSGNLSTWNSGPTHTTQASVVSLDDVREWVTVRDNTPMPGATRRLMRLRVNSP